MSEQEHVRRLGRTMKESEFTKALFEWLGVQEDEVFDPKYIEADHTSTESVFARDAIVLVSTPNISPDLVSSTRAKLGNTSYFVNGEEWHYGVSHGPDFVEDDE